MQIHVTDAAKHTLQQAMDANPGKKRASAMTQKAAGAR